MKKWLRRGRAAIGLGLTWAVGWLGVGVAFGLLAFNFEPAALAINALASGVAGFVGGALFSVVLGIADGRRRFDQLSILRFACWGTLGGVLVGGAQFAIFAAMGRPPDPLVFLTLQGVIGAGSAAGTLALARSADDRELLASGEEVSGIGLTAGEKRSLLGDEAGG